MIMPKETHEQALVSFDFEDQVVRTVQRNGQIWFVAADLCRVLGISKHRDAVSRLDDDERGSVLVDTLGGEQEAAAVNEAGLYSLILTSRMPNAKKFKRWVTHEVLPAIRQRGEYHMQGGATPDKLEASDARAYAQLLGQVRSIYGPMGADKVYRKLPLPEIEEEGESLRMARKFRDADLDMGEDEIDEAMSGWTLLDNLMRVEFARYGAGAGKPIGEMLLRAMDRDTICWSALADKGILALRRFMWN